MDIDDELQMLQRELMAVQQQKANPLSQRTVAEIMVKLYHNNFSFYPTTDGNQYVTPKELDRQIVKIVNQRTKINIMLLPQILNIGIDTIESRINPLTSQHNLIRHSNNLFSSQYFQSLIATLRQRLSSEGIIQLQQIAIQHELNIKFVEKLIQQNIKQLQAELSGSQLITRQYTLLKKSKIIGFLSSLSSPIRIQTLLKQSGIEGSNIEQLIQQLIAEKKLKGKYQNTYFIPEQFSNNQNKMIKQFYESNGFIQIPMLQKKYLVQRPQEWVKNNLTDAVFIEQFCFAPQKIESLAIQIATLLKTEGFVETSNILPVELDAKNMQQFLENYCSLKDYLICGNYCYSTQWLERCANEFKQKIIYSIFFKPLEQNKKDKKKNNKQLVITEEEIVETLFNCGLAEYSVAQNMAEELLPFLLQKLEQLKKKTEKELSQNKGFINSGFLKYKSCKTIVRTEESLNRMVNIIQKQQKKTEKWIDTDFGPNDQDKTGIYSLIYYDNALPKGWPSLEALRWKQISAKQLLINKNKNEAHCMKRLLLPNLIEIIEYYNKINGKKLLHSPQINPLTENSLPPFIYQFFITQKQRRIVLVDNLLPFIENGCFMIPGEYSFAEKAYAKLRYCYKATLGVGIQQLFFELTGLQLIKHTIQHEKDKGIVLSKLEQSLDRKDLIIIIGQGEMDKKIEWDGKQLQLIHMKPYMLDRMDKKLNIYPTSDLEIELNLQIVIDLFKNILIVPRPNEIKQMK